MVPQLGQSVIRIMLHLLLGSVILKASYVPGLKKLCDKDHIQSFVMLLGGSRAREDSIGKRVSRFKTCGFKKPRHLCQDFTHLFPNLNHSQAKNPQASHNKPFEPLWPQPQPDSVGRHRPPLQVWFSPQDSPSSKAWYTQPCIESQFSWVQGFLSSQSGA